MTDLTIADVLDVEYPDSPSWSADGAYIAVPIYEDNGQTLRIVAVETDPAEPWQVTLDDGFVTDLAWAPHPTSERLTLITDEGALFVVDATRKTTELLTDHADTDDVAWSADGGRLALYRDGCPCVIDLDSATRRYDVPKRGKFLGEDRMLAWGPDDRLLAYRFVDRDTKQVGVLDTTTGDLTWRSREVAFSTRSPEWLADGRLLVDRLGADGTVREFVAIDVEDGTETVLFREEDRINGIVSHGHPSVSLDGTLVAATLPLDGWEHLYVFDPATGERTRLTSGTFEDKGFADSPPQWLDDETPVFASNRHDSGRRDLFAVQFAQDEAEPSVRPLIIGAGTDVYPRPSPDGDRIAYIHANPSVSPEVRVADLDDTLDQRHDGAGPAATHARRVTTSAVREWPVEPIPPQRVRYESTDGREITAYLLDPRDSNSIPDDATNLPAVVWVHGGPMRQMRDGWHPSRSYGLAYTVHQYLAHNGYVGLFVNYRGGIGYGREFRQALAGNRGRDEMDDIAAGAAYLRDRPYVGDDIGIWGLSYGGYATLQLLGTRSDTFDVGVNLAGLADLEAYRDWAEATKYPAVTSSIAVRLGGEPWETTDAWALASPVTHMDDYETPLYSFHGTSDRYVNFEQLDIVVDRTLDLSLDAEWNYYPDETHVFSKRSTWEHALAEIEQTFEDHLGKD